jgi:ubiquinone/menaquinone biosynthesis C-methylase UbiE
MIERVLEPEAMDSVDEAREYDLMDHAAVNAAFVADLLAAVASTRRPLLRDGFVIDVGTGTARIPGELCHLEPACRVVGVDLAQEMLRVGQRNVTDVGQAGRVFLQRARVTALPFRDACAPVLMSNSLIHHLPDPVAAFGEMYRVVSSGGVVFVRDLFRPASLLELDHLVRVHAAVATPAQRQLFADSLHAALTLDEVRGIVRTLPFVTASVEATSDRHWTLVAIRT